MFCFGLQKFKDISMENIQIWLGKKLCKWNENKYHYIRLVYLCLLTHQTGDNKKKQICMCKPQCFDVIFKLTQLHSLKPICHIRKKNTFNVSFMFTFHVAFQFPLPQLKETFKTVKLYTTFPGQTFMSRLWSILIMQRCFETKQVPKQ